MIYALCGNILLTRVIVQFILSAKNIYPYSYFFQPVQTQPPNNRNTSIHRHVSANLCRIRQYIQRAAAPLTRVYWPLVFSIKHYLQIQNPSFKNFKGYEVTTLLRILYNTHPFFQSEYYGIVIQKLCRGSASDL